MGVGDVRYTVLQMVNEVFRKLNLAAITSLSANKLSIQCVDFINDVCNEMADAGDWQDMMVSANITAVSGRSDYSVTTSANIHHIADLYFSERKGPLSNVTIDDMRVMTRVTVTGTPTQYTIFGTDTNANPNIRVRPTPVAADDGGLFSVLYFIRAPLYTTADASTVIPYPSRVVVLGVLAKAILNESDGSPSDKYQIINQDYMNARKEGMQRFMGDTGWDVSFVPSLINRRRR